MNNERPIQKGGAGTSEREFGLRLGIMAMLMALFCVAIVMKLLSIQVLDVKKYREKASRQYDVVVTEKARRGRILDRHGRPLAESVETISFYADPKLVVNHVEVARQFSETFGKNRRYYLDLLRRPKRFVWMERNVPVSQAAGLMCSKIPGLRFSREQQRYYLNVGAQIIGFTDRDNHGISGLEKKYDKELKGRDGVRILQRSATGERYLAPDSEQIPPMAGQDLVLSIDADVQGILEEEITQALTDAKATAAMGIVMDVRSGEILAMANVPSFDMNSRNGVSSDAMRNRAITDMFEPGSTFKIIMAAGATERLGWNSSHMVDGHQGAIMLYGQPVRDHEPYGVMTFRKAITESSNVVAATTAMSIGAEGFYHYASAFGFGRKTGVGLIGESGGVLRSVSKWDRMTLPWMGYGYQVMATPLQVLQAYATLANDGARMRPFILKRIVDQDGKVISEIVPQKVTQAVKPETARYMTREYFRAVVEEGTGKAAAIVGIPVAGKTGTAQKLHNGSYQGWRYYLSSFVGFFPADNPQYAAIIVVDEPQTAYYASAVAAPFFSKICGRSLACSLEMQRRLKMNPPEKALLATISTVVVPDLRGLDDREAMRLLKWNGLEMQYQGKGAGYVLAQNVAPGSKVRRETKITVTLSGR